MKFSLLCATLASTLLLAEHIDEEEVREYEDISPQPAPSLSTTTTTTEPAEFEFQPWFTGPLLTPSGHVVPAGFINFEPYVFMNVQTGVYDGDWRQHDIDNFYNLNFQFPFFLGLTDWMDILVVPQFSWNYTDHVQDTVFNDFIVELDFQLLMDKPENNYPGIKFFVQEIFPTGTYQRRNPAKLTCDIGGSGSYQTTVGFVITRTFNPWCNNYLPMRLNVFYTIPSHVHVVGFNAYGGVADTNGTVIPGQGFGFLYGMEYNFDQNWAFALDVVGIWGTKTRFRGVSSVNNMNSPSSTQFSLAPAIEYNFSQALGIIGGVQFTVAGRNTSRNINAVFALNYFGPITGKPSGEFQEIDQGGGGGGGQGPGGGGHGGGR